MPHIDMKLGEVARIPQGKQRKPAQTITGVHACPMLRPATAHAGNGNGTSDRLIGAGPEQALAAVRPRDDKA